MLTIHGCDSALQDLLSTRSLPKGNKRSPAAVIAVTTKTRKTAVETVCNQPQKPRGGRKGMVQYSIAVQYGTQYTSLSLSHVLEHYGYYVPMASTLSLNESVLGLGDRVLGLSSASELPATWYLYTGTAGDMPVQMIDCLLLALLAIACWRVLTDHASCKIAWRCGHGGLRLAIYYYLRCYTHEYHPLAWDVCGMVRYKARH